MYKRSVNERKQKYNKILNFMELSSNEILYIVFTIEIVY